MRALEWVRQVVADQTLTSVDRLVAYALANHSTGGETSVSKASWKLIGCWTGLGRTSISEATRHLRDRGWIAILHQQRKDGSQDSSLYLFTIPAPVDDPEPEPVDNSDPRSPREPPPFATRTPPEHDPRSPRGPLEGIKGSSKVPPVQARPVDQVIASIARARKLR